MEHKPIYPEIRPEKVAIPPGASLASWLNSRIARYETRSLDWHALKFQADYDQKYRRAQMRYIGTGGTGVESDDNVVPAEHFTFSTMVLPAGCEGPLHLHTDAEEVFFVPRILEAQLFGLEDFRHVAANHPADMHPCLFLLGSAIHLHTSPCRGGQVPIPGRPTLALSSLLRWLSGSAASPHAHFQPS